ncbi:MAG: threonine synthase [Oscillospiraceae bacterium]
MEFISTRNALNTVSSAKAILKGLSDEGGLFVPQSFPHVALEQLMSLTYQELATKLIGMYLTDYDEAFLTNAVAKAYSDANFENKAGYTVKVSENIYSLELWHGPTCAFKDYALQLMPHLLVEAKKILKETDITKILVATSGDTGKAALAGYADIDGVKIAVFYPNSGTSEIQRLQMATQTGNNVEVYAVNGNFDDAQTGVKKVFRNSELSKELLCKGEKLSSANSINWGRLVPQLVYYFYSYFTLVNNKEISLGDKVDFCVPTGNFGDILAGYYAKQMGLPINKLICASNKNNVLSEFINTGVYNAKREFYKTTSPSMDILVSSNLERLLYHLCEDANKVSAWMKDLEKNGTYTIDSETLDKLQQVFAADYADDAQVAGEIKRQFTENKYLCDTHTAVAFLAAARAERKAEIPCIVVSTANPYKFSSDVLFAICGKTCSDEFACLQELSILTGNIAPKSLSELKEKPVRFTKVIEPSEIAKAALQL